MMKHVILAMAALLMLCVSTLHAFDTGPRPVLVSPLESAAVTTPPPRHSGVLRAAGSLDEIAPPARFQGDNYAVALFGGADAITALCGGVRADGKVPLACTSDHTDGAAQSMPAGARRSVRSDPLSRARPRQRLAANHGD